MEHVFDRPEVDVGDDTAEVAEYVRRIHEAELLDHIGIDPSGVGQILDSLVRSVNLTLCEMGLPEITRDQCRQFVGNGARVLMEKALMASGARDLSRIEEAMEIYGRIFHENCMYHVEPYAKIRELLEGLTEHQIERAVLSNKPHVQTVQVVQDVFGKELFSYVQGQCEGYPKKPDPTMVFAIARKLGRKIEECVYIGDSEVDIRTGSAAGMRTIGVTWGFRSKEELLEAGAVETVDDPLEILELIS